MTIAVLLLVTFIYIARKYKLRQRDYVCHVYRFDSYDDSHYEREVEYSTTLVKATEVVLAVYHMAVILVGFVLCNTSAKLKMNHCTIV